VTVRSDGVERRIKVEDWFDRVLSLETPTGEGGDVLFGYDIENEQPFAFFTKEIVNR
jgi:hypothetical protein